jgi:hypothetical protein
MTLRRKIDDVLRFYKPAIIGYEHLARNDFLTFASRFIVFEIRRPFAPELQGNAFAHHANGVHSIDDRIDALFQQVALCDLYGQPLKDRAERVLKDLEKRNTNGKVAMDVLAALAAEKDAAEKAAKDTGLTPKAFAVFWTLREELALKQCGIDPLELAREIEKLLARFPNFRVNADEQRQLRAALYRPLITIAKEPRTLIVDRIVANLLN